MDVRHSATDERERICGSPGPTGDVPAFHWNNNSEFACVAVGKRASLNPSPKAAAERALLSPRVSPVGESETM